MKTKQNMQSIQSCEKQRYDSTDIETSHAIPNSINRLDKAVVVLCENMNILIERLVPICWPSGDEVVCASDPETAVQQSPIAERVSNIGNFVQQINSKVIYILDHLEI